MTDFHVHEFQERLPDGATVAPVILSSDKTRLSQFRGDKSAWPVYLTIGNISKDMRRQASSHATVLIGYIPVGKFQCFSEKARQAERYRTFHHCMAILTESLVEAGKSGVDMNCADGFVRWIWPILAAYVADYPEQCLVASCMENRCPICKVNPNDRGSHEPSHPRDRRETLELLQKKELNTLNNSNDKEKYANLGLRPIFPPFWARLPFSDIFQSFTPDLLHQLHKGVFKDHLVKWCTAILGEKEVDERFKSMPDHPGLRHFKNGISSVSQWTGKEHKAMERVFVGVVAEFSRDERVLRTARAVVDFIFLASLQSHTTQTLEALSQALDQFHANKDVFVELEARVPGHFNIPKIHSMEHYVELIERFGSADGFNTESPEWLHIDYAKNAYRASNKKDYTRQMTNWLWRQEAVDRFSLYLNWIANGSLPGNAGERQELVQEIVREAGPVDILPDAAESSSATGIAVSIGGNQQIETTYHTATNHPPGLRGIRASVIISDHGASRFLEAVQTFISAHGSPITPHLFDGFDLFKRITVLLPAIPHASPSDHKNIVRASPPVRAGLQTAAEPAHLDFALVRTGEKNEKTEGTSLAGMRLAHVRVLFRLPPIYRIKTRHPLAYVEWYTPFGTPDPATGLHTVKKSSRNRRVYGEIIEVDRIVRNCHVMPKYGRKKPSSWTSENVVDHCSAFYPSPYSDTHMFVLMKVGLAIHTT